MNLCFQLETCTRHVRVALHRILVARQGSGNSTSPVTLPPVSISESPPMPRYQVQCPLLLSVPFLMTFQPHTMSSSQPDTPTVTTPVQSMSLPQPLQRLCLLLLLPLFLLCVTLLFASLLTNTNITSSLRVNLPQTPSSPPQTKLVAQRPTASPHILQQATHPSERPSLPLMAQSQPQALLLGLSPPQSCRTCCSRLRHCLIPCKSFLVHM